LAKQHLNLTEYHWLIGFSLAALLLGTVSLGNVPLRDWDEGTRALIAREMYRTGNWLHPTLQGEPYLLKPPLMDWFISLAYKFGGIGELTTRLPGAFLSAWGVPLLYGLGRELFAQNLPAVLAASVYLTLLPVVRHGRLAMLDGTVVSFFLLLLLCLLKARHDKRWAVGIGISLGLITLTKGILVILLGAIAFGFLVADGQLAQLKHPYFWLGLLWGSTPAIAWYTAQWQFYGETFWQVHFQAQGLNRISESVEGNQGAPWYYVLELLKYSFPWLLFWFSGLALAWHHRQRSWGKLILIGTLGYLGTISVMGTKLPWYIMPLYPFFALAVGMALAQLWQKSKYYPQILVWLLGLMAMAGLGGCIYFIVADPQPVLILMGVVVALTMGLAAWRVYQHNHQFIPILLGGTYLALLCLMLSTSWVWELNEAFAVKPVAQLIQEHIPPDTVVYTSFGYRRPSLEFYSDRPVIPADTTTLQQLASTSAYLLVDESTLAILPVRDRVILGSTEGLTLISITN